jgi:hypothetical protein
VRVVCEPKKMNPIDQEFRPKRDFFVAWFLVAVAAIALGRPWTFDLPWFSKVAWTVVVPFIGTFFVYGPVMLMRLVIRSGSRGWVVFRTFLSVVLGVGLIFGVIHVAGMDTSIVGRIASMVLPALAIICLGLRTKRGSASQPAVPTQRSCLPYHQDPPPGAANL